MLAILECFSTVERKLSVAEIAVRTGMPRGTAHRIIRTMRHLGLLEQDRQRDQYRLGMKLFELGTTVLANMDLHREAQDRVEALSQASGATVHLSVFDGVNSTVINRSDPDGERVNTIFVLESSPAHASACGKAVLAFQPKEAIERLIERGLARLTPTTIVDPDGLRSELEQIRRQGYAFNNGELKPNVRCVGAPIRNISGQVFAAISVSGPAQRFTDARMAGYADLVVSYADAISAQLGHRPDRALPRPTAGRGRQTELATK